MKKTKLFLTLAMVIFGMAFFVTITKAEQIEIPQNPTLEQIKEINAKLAADSATMSTVNSEVVVVATVNVYSAKIVNQNGNAFDISFDLNNMEGTQSGIKYAIELTRNKDNQSIDETVYQDVINLGVDQTISKQFTYTAPSYLSGDFNLVLSVKNENGLPLSNVSLGSITLKGTNEYLEIIANSCAIKDGGADMQISCDIKNHYKIAQTFTPYFETYLRGVFGKVVSSAQDAQQSVSINPDKQKTISLALAKQSQPQEYAVVLGLKDVSGNIVSNQYIFSESVAGQTATIQNIKLDKDYYQKGETAKLSLFFDGSGGVSSMLSLSIKNKEDGDCVTEFKQQLNLNKSDNYFELPIVADCKDPHIQAAIQDSNGNVLDQQDLSVESQNIPKLSQAQTSQPNNILKYGIILVLILLITSLLIIVFKKRKGVSVIIFFILAGGIFLSSGVGVKANTMYVTEADHLVADVHGCNNSSRFKVWYVTSLIGGVAEYSPGDRVHLKVDTYVETNGCAYYYAEGTYGENFFGAYLTPGNEDLVLCKPVPAPPTQDHTMVDGGSSVSTCGSKSPTYSFNQSFLIDLSEAPGLHTKFIFDQFILLFPSAEVSFWIPITYRIKNNTAPAPNACTSPTMHNGILTATPNPCTLVNGQTSCSSTISWNPAQGTILERIDQTSGTDTFNFAATGTVVDNNIHGCGILYKLFKNSSVLADSILVKTQNPVSTSPALGTLTAPDTCTVPVGKSTCDRTKVGIGWTSTGATNLNLSWIPTTMSLQGVSNPWTVISEWVPGVTIYWFPIPYPSATFYLKNGATLLKSKTVTAVCQSGSVWNGSICAAITYSCTGTVPANATMFTNDNVNLLENTPYTYWPIDTGTRCQYSCNGGYNWNGSTCAVAAPLSCNADTISFCVLPPTSSGSSAAGSCSPSYNGSCNYTCTNGTWTKNSNLCAAGCTLPVCGAASTICIGTTCTDCSGLTTGTKNCSGWKEVSPN